jgi:hypothetical protein
MPIGADFQLARQQTETRHGESDKKSIPLGCASFAA